MENETDKIMLHGMRRKKQTLLLHFRDESKNKLRIGRNYSQLAHVMKNLGLHMLKIKRFQSVNYWRPVCAMYTAHVRKHSMNSLTSKSMERKKNRQLPLTRYVVQFPSMIT